MRSGRIAGTLAQAGPPCVACGVRAKHGAPSRLDRNPLAKRSLWRTRFVWTLARDSLTICERSVEQRSTPATRERVTTLGAMPGPANNSAEIDNKALAMQGEGLVAFKGFERLVKACGLCLAASGTAEETVRRQEAACRTCFFRNSRGLWNSIAPMVGPLDPKTLNEPIGSTILLN